MEGEVKLLGYVTEEKHMSERVIDPAGICFTLMAMTHGYGQGYVYEESRKRSRARLRGINTERDGTAMTIKANYWKVSGSNFWRTKDWGATGVIEYEDCTTDKPYAGRSGEDAEG